MHINPLKMVIEINHFDGVEYALFMSNLYFAPKINKHENKKLPKAKLGVRFIAPV